MNSQADIRKNVTEQIIDSLKNGGLPPWRKAWSDDPNAPGLHTSLSTGHGCPLWPARFGMPRDDAAARYGDALLQRKRFPIDVPLDAMPDPREWAREVVERESRWA